MATKLVYSLTTPRFLHASFKRPFISAPSSSLPSASRLPFIDFAGRKIAVRRRFLVLCPKATTDQPGQVQEDEVEVDDSKILPYCNIDRKEKKSLGEMEQDFLQALQAFYYEGKAIMSNEEFDNLKEELMWEGSSVVMLSADEQRFLEASMAYVAGTPIMSDEEFDKLKMKLKMDGSDIVVEGPRCSLRSRKVYSDLSVDYLKMFLLNVPAAVVALGLFFFLDDLTGFEITYLLELPEPFSFIFTWFAALPFILWLSFSITGFIVKDFLILKGPCPNCGTENTSFFGTILSVSSGGSSNTVKCTNCGTDMVYDSSTRLITLPEGSSA
nr:PGR5-like protein 1A, chloroplastic [Ipomoea batatas]